MRSAPASPTTRPFTPMFPQSSATTLVKIRFCRMLKPICLPTSSQRSYVLEHLDELVVKAVGESGGYGMLIGPHSSDEEQG